MSKDPLGESKGKLGVLQRAYEVDERRALEEKKRVDAIVDERQKIVEELEGERDALETKLQTLRGQDKRNALHTGDAGQLAAIERYAKRLQLQAGALDSVLEERRKELQQAVERSGFAEQELLAARMEKKKVERILKNRADTVRAVNEASNEALADEMSFYRPKK